MMKDKLSRSLSISQVCNYEVCVFFFIPLDMPSEHHRARLIAIELYRWFTVRADVSLTTNIHLLNPDLKARGEERVRDGRIGQC